VTSPAGSEIFDDQSAVIIKRPAIRELAPDFRVNDKAGIKHSLGQFRTGNEHLKMATWDSES
jgi:hypothetical protein